MTDKDERKTYDEALAQMQAQISFDTLAWDEQVLTERCPHCGNGMVWYEHRTATSDGTTHVIGSDCGCTWCDATWYDDVSFYGASSGGDV